MVQKPIDTRLVYGFLSSGKTFFIQDCIRNDFFHKYGTTLILCFEQGQSEYDLDLLSAKRTHVEFFEGMAEPEDVAVFCQKNISKYQPDRIYAEMNIMMQGLRDMFPEIMNVTYVTTRIAWRTLKLYLDNFSPMMNEMVRASHQITFVDCPSKEILAPYSQTFRLMNRSASYLRQDPMGYHEKAFDIFVPFSLDRTEIVITENMYLPLWLDAADHPEHYDGKTLIFTDPLELRRQGENEPWIAGRVVMTCCMADLQFMGFELSREDTLSANSGWILLEALALPGTDRYGRRILKLQPLKTNSATPPESLILSAR